MDHLRFPVGRFTAPTNISPEDRARYIHTLDHFPQQLTATVADWSDTQLDTPYRPEGWTARQVIHHVADSHANCFIRFKLALTEDNPTIKPYHENIWAEGVDYQIPAEASLAIINGIHTRWVHLLKNMSAEDFQKTFYHPELKKALTLDGALALYDWHSRHHLGHVNLVKGKLVV